MDESSPPQLTFLKQTADELFANSGCHKEQLTNECIDVAILLLTSKQYLAVTINQILPVEFILEALNIVEPEKLAKYFQLMTRSLATVHSPNIFLLLAPRSLSSYQAITSLSEAGKNLLQLAPFIEVMKYKSHFRLLMNMLSITSLGATRNVMDIMATVLQHSHEDPPITEKEAGHLANYSAIRISQSFSSNFGLEFLTTCLQLLNQLAIIFPICGNEPLVGKVLLQAHKISRQSPETYQLLVSIFCSFCRVPMPELINSAKARFEKVIYLTLEHENVFSDDQFIQAQLSLLEETKQLAIFEKFSHEPIHDISF